MTLVASFLNKLDEQIERTRHLISLVPEDQLEWRPAPGAMRLCDLLGHLLECLAGFCAALYAIDTERLAHFAELRDLPVNHCCTAEEALERIRVYEDHIREGFSILNDQALADCIPTVFVPGGEPLLAILLGNLEHFINHKHQLFFCLKLLGVKVATADLYRLGGGE